MNSELTMQQPIAETLEQNYMPYAMSVIVSRAIPEIDGLKPSHRKLLYTMYKMGLLTGPRTKCANIVGQTMKLNPHGDAAIYETLVRLTRGNGALLHPFIDSKGNFGKQFSRDMAYAASRYTEAKLEPICREIFAEIDKNTVDFVPNYDGTLEEPVLFPTRYPNLLVNPNQGIAVGMASNICSFNLREVCKATTAYLKNPNVDLLKSMPAPDFPTGGELLYDEAEMRGIYETGRGSFRVRARYEYDKKNNCIDIKEIPYSTSCEAIIEKIVELIKAGKIREITDIRDETDKKGLKITIDLKRGTDPEKLMNRLYKMTPLMDSFSCNFNVLIGSEPRQLGVRDLLKEWTRFRMGCIRRRLQFDIDKKSKQLHLLQGLEKLLLDIDKAIRIIRNTEAEADVVPNLMSGFDIDEVQAEYIAEIRLRQLNREYIIKRTQDIEDLIDDLALLNATLADEGKIKEVMVGELADIAKTYGENRKTVLITPEIAEEEVEEIPVEDYPVKLFYTRGGYLKKISYSSLRGNAEQKLKEGDEITQIFDTSNKTEILVFTDQANVYKTKTYETPDCKASQMGEYLPSLLKMEEGEMPVGIAVTTDYKGFILFAFANGKMAKVDLAAYETKLNRKRLVGAYSTHSPLVSLLCLPEDTMLACFSSIDKVLVFSTGEIAPKTTKNTQGVQVMTLKRSATLSKVLPAQEAGLTDCDYYRTKRIPAVGCFRRDEDSSQVTIL